MFYCPGNTSAAVRTFSLAGGSSEVHFSTHSFTFTLPLLARLFIYIHATCLWSQLVITYLVISFWDM